MTYEPCTIESYQERHADELGLKLSEIRTVLPGEFDGDRVRVCLHERYLLVEMGGVTAAVPLVSAMTTLQEVNA